MADATVDAERFRPRNPADVINVMAQWFMGTDEPPTDQAENAACELQDRLEAEGWVLRRKPPEGADLILTERQRQIDDEGWTPEHDTHHDQGELALAALYYLQSSVDFAGGDPPWPWAVMADKSTWPPVGEDRVRDLTKAGALIAAEIDRLAATTDAWDGRPPCATCQSRRFVATGGPDGWPCPDCNTPATVALPEPF